jgi:hypothetical protein
VATNGDLGAGEVHGVGGALGEAEPWADLAGGGRSMTGFPWRRMANDAELMGARRSSSCLKVRSTCSAVMWAHRTTAPVVLRHGGAMVTPDTARDRGPR